MAGGTDSVQTSNGNENLALWAKACTTALPFLPIWEKEQLWKEFNWDTMSFKIWPPQGMWHASILQELYYRSGVALKNRILEARITGKQHCTPCSQNLHQFHRLRFRNFFRKGSQNLAIWVANHHAKPHTVRFPKQSTIKIYLHRTRTWGLPFYRTSRATNWRPLLPMACDKGL